VELDDLHVLGTVAGHLVDVLRRVAGHAEPDHADRAVAHVLGFVGGHRRADDLDGVGDSQAAGELLRAQDRGTGAVGRRAALEKRQRIVDLARREHLFEGARVLVLGTRVVHRVAMVLDRHLRELLTGRTVELHVLAPARTEDARGDRRLLLLFLPVLRRLLVLEPLELVLEGALLHLLEAERQHALVDPERDRLPAEIERGGAGRAVVVDVVDRDPGHAEAVHRALTVGAHAVHVADEGLLDPVVRNPGHLERRRAGFLRQIHEIAVAALELRHADPDHANVPALLHDATPLARLVPGTWPASKLTLLT
jgi:hypothetical protein